MADDGAPYPAHWEADVVLRDGATMRIRPIRPDDAAALQRFHVRQSPESTYFRFFAPLARLSDADLDRLTVVDHRDRVALVLVSGGEIVAVGRYDRVTPDEAEVAFNVADALQGRGLGSVLLEHLAAAARERGVRRFVADVLPGNARMIHVFRDAGYDVRQAYEDGVLSVAFEIDPTERSLAVMAERERRAEARSMAGLLAAGSVAVVAEGDVEAAAAVATARRLLAGDFTGQVHLVGPAFVGAVPVGDAPSGSGPGSGSGPRPPTSVRIRLEDLDAAVDLLVAGAPAERLPALVTRAAALGTHGVVVLPGARTDADAAAHHQAAVLRAARDAGVRLVGPESYGLVASGPHGRLTATPATALPPAGAVGVFCQSAAAGVSLLQALRRRGLGIGTFLSAGHRADLSGNDALQYWTQDPGTRVACVYLESIGNPRKFTHVARTLAARVPVVAVVSGATGQAVPPGHRVRTSREPRRVLEELLRQAFVIRAESTHEMLDVAQLVAAQPTPRGRRVAVLTNSGSLGSLVAEIARARGLAAAGEPVHLAAGAGAPEYGEALEALVARGDWDALVVAYVPLLGERDPAVGRAVAAAAAASGRTTLACVLGLHGLPEELGDDDGGRVPAYATVEDAVGALAAVVTDAERRAARPAPAGPPAGTDPRRARDLLAAEVAGLAPAQVRRLPAQRAAELLRAYGIEVWPTRTVAGADAAVAAADELGRPVAVKASDERLRHRLDLGGVRLDLADADDVRDAVAGLAALGAATVEVQSMAPRGVACVVRASEDELYGPVVAFGLAGDAVDLLGDVAYRIPPLTAADAAEMVRSVRAAPRLLGGGGDLPADVAALADLVARVAALVDDHPEVAHLLLHPVVVAPAGLTVLDARVDVGPPRRPGGPRRVLPG